MIDNDKILFSLVVPAYNEEKMLPACLASLRKQAGNFSYEIIVVDNDSTDRTGEVAKSHGIMIINESQRGAGNARRTGTEAAQGEYVLHLDADTRLPEDYLVNVLSRFENDPKLVCLGGQFCFYDAPRWKNILRVPVYYFLWIFVVIICRIKIGPMGNNMTFKKEIYDKTSGFDPELRFCEDADLARKLSCFGKVKLDMSLKCYVSARRYKINFNILFQLLNLMWFCFLGRPLKNEFKKI